MKFAEDGSWCNRRAVVLTSLAILLANLSWVFLQLGRDLWQDELLLAELTRPSFSGIIRSTIQTANHSPVFLLYVKVVRLLLGDGALQLRLSSLIPALLSALFCFRISTRIARLDPGEALFCTAVFCVLPVSLFGMTNFRPYGLALLGITAALYYCLRFRESGKVAHLILSAGALTVAVYCQYIYGLFALSIIYLLCFQPHPHGQRRGVGIFILSLVIFLAPVCIHVMQVAARAQSLYFTTGPSMGELVRYISSSPLIVLLLLYQTSLFKRVRKSEVTHLFQRLSLFTFLIPPVVFYLLHITTGVSLWSDRYRFWAEIPFVFFFGIVLAAQRGLLRITWALAVFLLVMSYSTAPEGSSWRLVHTIISRELARNPHTVLVAQTGFIEANNLSFLQQEKWRNYLLSPLRYYGYTGDALLLPFCATNREQTSYITQTVEAVAKSASDQVILVTLPCHFGYDDVGLHFMETMLASGFTLTQKIQPKTSNTFIYRFQRDD